MEEAFYAALDTSPDELFCLVVRNSTRLNRAPLKAAIHRSSKEQAVRLCDALARFSDLQVQAFQNLDSSQWENIDDFKTPSPKRTRRRRPCASPKSGRKNECHGSSSSRKNFILANLKACAMLTHLALSHPLKVFQPCDLFPTVQTLHAQLVFFEDDIELQDNIASLCETWWKDHLPGRESLIAQSLPFLLSKSLEFGKKTHVHRVYHMREAFTLFDFTDESIEDLKRLLMRCVLTPAYLRLPDGRRFVTSLFNLNGQLTKELIIMVKSQIPFGRKSILEAYGEILFRAWKAAEDPCLQEIEVSCVQSFIEGAVYASSKTLASSIRKVLAAFIAQRMQEGVEALLFRLQEPILFRSLQVANSNVRRNALLLLIEMFPLEDPNASKEENDILLEKQFFFFERLLTDPCPDIRATAVEGVCRILRLFWEVVSSAITVKLLSKLIDETAQDKSNTVVRCAILHGITYLLENPASHELLKALLPKLSFLLSDCKLAVRIAMVDMLLAIKGIRGIPLLKIVSLEAMLSALDDDKPPVARRLTRLLIPSYFPSKVPVAVACTRCMTLIKRSPRAGARFCEWAAMEGVSRSSLFELVKTFITQFSSQTGIDPGEREAILVALNKLCRSLAAEKELKGLLGSLLNTETLKSLLINATTSASRTSIVQLISVINPADMPEILQYCSDLVVNSANDALERLDSTEAKAVHSLILAWGSFSDFVEALVKRLSQVASEASEVIPISSDVKSVKRNRRQSTLCKSPWTTSMTKICNSQKGKKATGSFGDCQATVDMYNAVGAAWHVENLVEVDETRKALLAHGSLPLLISGLRNIAYTVLQANLDLGVPDILKVSSIKVYAALTIHLAISRKNVEKASTCTGDQDLPMNEGDRITSACRELIDWTTTLQDFAVLRSNPSENVKKKTKFDRNLRSRERNPLFEISSNTLQSGDTNSTGSSEVDAFLTNIRLSNASLESLSYFFSLNLVKDESVQDAYQELATKLVHCCMEWLKAWEMEQIETWKKQCNDKLKDLLSCVRGTAAHAAKMLYVSIRGNIGKVMQFADLANGLLDLIMLSDCFFGSKGAVSVFSALRPWIPDIFICISSSIKPMAENTSSPDDFDHLRSKFLRPWISNFCMSAYSLEMQDTSSSRVSETSETSKETGTSQSAAASKIKQRASFSTSMLTKVSKLLRRGNPRVLQGILVLFLWQAVFAMKMEDYCNTLGALDIVDTKLMKRRESSLKVALPACSLADCGEILKHVDARLEARLEGTSHDLDEQQKALKKIKLLAESLLSAGVSC